MNFFWVYDIPSWLFAIITIVVYVLLGLIGLYATRNWVRRLHQIDHSHNDIVGYYLAAVTVFYGITLGLVAVGTWNTFSAINEKVDEEAQVIASIHRDIGTYSDPYKSQMRQDLEGYVKNVVEVSWPLQRKGIVPVKSGTYLDTFQYHLMSFKPQSMAEQIIQAELFKQYNLLVEYRRARLNAVHNHLPGALWAMVIIGGFICVIVTFFFDTKSFNMHFWMTSLFSGLLGLMIFLIGTLDNPFRGDLSVSPAPIELVYHQLIKDKSASPSLSIDTLVKK